MGPPIVANSHIEPEASWSGSYIKAGTDKRSPDAGVLPLTTMTFFWVGSCSTVPCGNSEPSKMMALALKFYTEVRIGFLQKSRVTVF